MGDCFITRRGGSGTSKSFAVISVSYPAGSVCTCSDGTKTLKLKDTSGQGFFLIPYAGTWIVTATDGTNTKSESVEITSEGQSVNVTLSYTLYLFREGYGINNDLILNGFYPPFAITNNDLPFTLNFGVISSEHMKSTNESTGNTYWVSELIDVSAYNALYVDLICGSRYDSGKVVTIGVGPDVPSEANQLGTWAASTPNIYNTTRETVTVDLSAITGKMYVKIGAWGIIHNIYNWWLE